MRVCVCTRVCVRVSMSIQRARPRPGARPLDPPQVIQLAFLVACLYTGVGVLRLGWIIDFLSHSVITGFTSGAAIIIALSQVGGCSPRLLVVWGKEGGAGRNGANALLVIYQPRALGSLASRCPTWAGLGACDRVALGWAGRGKGAAVQLERQLAPGSCRSRRRCWSAAGSRHHWRSPLPCLSATSPGVALVVQARGCAESTRYPQHADSHHPSGRSNTSWAAA